MTAIDIDFSVLEFLDFEPTVPCETDTKDCDNPVAWKVAIRCCGISLLICEECYQRLTGYIKSMPNAYVICRKCKSSKLLSEAYLFDKL